jgi:DNA-binding NarL/FixJ family response regulator
MARIRILLVDDHQLVRAGLRSLVDKFSDCEVIAEAGNGNEALELARKLKPDVMMLDIAMAGLNGLEVTAALTKELPAIKILILSMHTGEEYVMQALKSGAVGYLLKDSATMELALALQAVGRGDTYLSPAVSKHLVQNLSRSNQAHSDNLTPRQREILQLIAEGKSTKEIAFFLNLSAKTVEAHRAQLMERLGIYDVAGLVRHAMKIGIVPPVG